MEAILRLGNIRIGIEFSWKRMIGAAAIAGLLACLYTAVVYQQVRMREEPGGAAVESRHELADPGIHMQMHLDGLGESQPLDLAAVKGLQALSGLLEKPETAVSEPENLPAMGNAGTVENGTMIEDGSQSVETPAMVTVRLHGNGGVPELSTVSGSMDSVQEDGWNRPRRLGKVFDGWYLDPAGETPYEGLTEDMTMADVYAGWREFEGFYSNDSGYITGYSSFSIVVDGTLALPTHEDCLGIENDALRGMEDWIADIYIPANIAHIAPDAFKELHNLMYIQAEEGNPWYYSVDGILYSRDGTVAARPVWAVETAE